MRSRNRLPKSRPHSWLPAGGLRLEALEDRTVPTGDLHPHEFLHPTAPPGSTPHAEEYVLGSKWPQAGGLGSHVTITYSYSNLLDGGMDLSDDDLRAAVEEALGRWAAHAPLDFVEVADSGPAPGDNSYSAAGHPKLRFGHHAEDGTWGVLAHAYYPSTDGLGGDLHFDNGETWVTDPNVGGFAIDFLEVAVHEIGHAIGLGHEPSPPQGDDAIMNPYYGERFDGLGTAFLLQDDIDGIIAQYGAGTGSVTPLISAADVGDTLGTALATNLVPGGGYVRGNGTVGDGPFGTLDVDLYKIEAAVGTTLTAETALPTGGTAADTVLRLFDAAGDQVDLDDDTGAGDYSLLTYTFAAAGTYYVGVSGSPNDAYDPAAGGSGVGGGTGSYRLTLNLEVGDTLDTARDTGVAGGGQYVQAGGVVGNGPFGGSDADLYRFTAAAGTTLTARTDLPVGSGDSVDTMLRLFDAAGTQLAIDDDSGPGNYSLITYTFGTAGTYYVGVSGYANDTYNPVTGGGSESGDTGDYRLDLGLNAAGPLTVDGTSAADTVTYSAGGNHSLTTNGRTTTYALSAVTAVVINGGSGGDAVTVTATAAAAPVAVFGEGGNDAVTASGVADPVSLSGQDGNDTLTGGAGADALTGGAGSDRLAGGSGGDTYRFAAATAAETDTVVETSSAGVDLLDFTALSAAVTVNLGSDTATATHANRTVRTGGAGQAANLENAAGGAGNDTLTGNSAANLLAGNGGNDSLNGGSGNDTLDGGAGSDRLAGASGNDTYLFAAAAAAETDTVVEGSGGGTDALDFSALTTGVTVSLAGTTTALGSHANRTLLVSPSDTARYIENVVGGAGNDTFTGGSASNNLAGGGGNDSLNGGSGNDTLNGGEGNDTLNGSSGNDVLAGGAGSDSLTGGSGNDVYLFTAAGAAETDTVVELSGGGTDRLDFAALAAGDDLTVNLGTGTTALGGHANRTLAVGAAGQANYLERVTGGAGDDAITGGSAGNNLVGGAGDDTLAGGSGNDVLDGGAGNDSLVGGSGNDRYAFGAVTAAEVDTVVELGGGGTDTLDFAAVAVAVTVNLTNNSGIASHGSGATLRTVNTGAAGQAANWENAYGGSGADTLVGNGNNNVLNGRAGDDTMTGGLGADSFIGGTGTDLVTDFNAGQGDTQSDVP